MKPAGITIIQRRVGDAILLIGSPLVASTGSRDGFILLVACSERQARPVRFKCTALLQRSVVKLSC